jgi:hypothetical protein
MALATRLAMVPVTISAMRLPLFISILRFS